MKAEILTDLTPEQIRDYWKRINAPVFVRRYKRSGKTALCRKPSCTIRQVEQFLLSDEIL